MLGTTILLPAHTALDCFLSSRELHQTNYVGCLLAQAEHEAVRERLLHTADYFSSEDNSVDARVEACAEAEYYGDWNF